MTVVHRPFTTDPYREASRPRAPRTTAHRRIEEMHATRGRIDMQSPQPIHDAVAHVGRLIDELETLFG